MTAGPILPRGRRALAATVRGPAAVWLYNLASDRAADSIRHFMSTGEEETAREIGAALAELREAATQLRDASGRGTTEVSSRPIPRGSTSNLDGFHVGLDVRGAAAALDLGERRVRQLLTAGALRGTQDRTGRWSVDPDDVDRLRADREATA